MADVRLIDANSVCKKIVESIRYAEEWANEAREQQDAIGLQYASDTYSSLISMLERIQNEPTIEAEPVKQGRWEVNGDRFYPFCSNCKYEPPKELIRCNALSLEPILTKYCPNCGSENGTRIYRGGENNG